MRKNQNKKKKLATRFSLINMYFIVFIMILTIAVCVTMIYNIADTAAMDYARTYTIESVDIMGSYINNMVLIARQASNSTEVIEWFANESDPDKMMTAFNRLIFLTGMLQEGSLNFVIADSLNSYSVESEMEFNDFAPTAILDPMNSDDDWFFSASRTMFDFTMNIGMRHESDDLRLWINHKVEKDGDLVGVLSIAQEFNEIFYDLFDLYATHAVKGYIIDYRGIIQIDSTMTSPGNYSGGNTHILSINSDPAFINLISNDYLRNPSIYYGRRTEPEIIRLPGEDSRYLSVAPIPNTNWLAVTFFDTSSFFDIMSIIPPIGAVVLAMIVYVTASSVLIRKIVFKPLGELTDSVAGSVHDERDIYGIERNDEIGELARTTKEAWRRLNDMTIELKAAAHEAEVANLSKSAFLANMSHEIRTPMNVILGVAEIMMQDENLDKKAYDELVTIYNSGDMLLNIINDILDLSKIEAGKLELINDSYDIASIIHDTMVLNMMHAGSKPIEFKLSVDETIPATLIGDELRLKQILNNLLSNAFKYTASGNVDLSFSMEDEGEEKLITLVITVKDTGQGMTEEQVRTIFDEYSRFINKANLYTEGTGLGMSITRNLVHLMDGSISVESELDVGSLFSVRLPQGRTGANALGRDLAESLQDFSLSGIKQIKKLSLIYDHMPYGTILVVDDVESNLFVARGLMAPYGLNIETVTSGYKAIDKIKEGNVYDIVFMDHMMPKLDGIETTEILRKMGYTAPIIALSANAVVGQADTFLASGFDDFIPKPVDVRHLNTLLKKYVRDKQSPEVLAAAEAQKNGISTSDYDEKPSVSPQLVEFFVKDSVNAVEQIRTIKDKQDSYDSEDVKLFTTTVHAMKNALANVGEMRLSEYFEVMEKAGWRSDTTTIDNEISTIIFKLEEVIDKYRLHEAEDDYLDSDFIYLQEQIRSFKDACQGFDKKTAKEIMIHLRQHKWPSKIKELLGAAAEQLLSGDVDLAVDSADKISKLVLDYIK